MQWVCFGIEGRLPVLILAQYFLTWSTEYGVAVDEALGH